MAYKEAPVSANGMGWLGPWMLVSVAFFAAVSPTRSLLMVVVYLVTIACGAALCVADRRERGQ